MRALASAAKELPLKMAGSTVFGRYPKISLEQTYNMILSDGWLVPAAGYVRVSDILDNGNGRGIYASTKFNHMIAVIEDGVYIVNRNLAATRIASIDTFEGDVFIDENNANQIAICDKKDIYIYNYVANSFTKATLDFLPGYIAFQGTYFISVDLNSAEWRLSAESNGLSWPSTSTSVGEFQTKADVPQAVIRVPGKGNLIFVIGRTVTELWTQTGAQLFPYQRNSSFNIDYGCINPATIATNDQIIVWIGRNEKSGISILYSNGGSPQKISTDGIDFKLANLTNPEECYGFLFQQDGHQIYVVTWPGDNISYAYDFNTKAFFTFTDEKMDYYVAKRVVAFNNSYYFVSFKDGHLYELNTRYTDYDGKAAVRIRIPPSVRLPDSTGFIVNNINFTIAQGNASQIQRIDFSMSKDGGESFSNTFSKTLNTLGSRKNQFNLWNLGKANDFIPQFRFWGFDRFVATDGTVRVYQ